MSSGQQPPNPLLLLGQYSDDEVDEESDKRLERGILDGSVSDHDDKVIWVSLLFFVKLCFVGPRWEPLDWI